LRNFSGPDVAVSMPKELLLLFLLYRRETSAVERDFNECILAYRAKMHIDRFMYFSRGHILHLSAYLFLVAEYAVVRASPVRDEDRYDHMLFAHFSTFMLRMASLAAFCSASFLLLPVPSPYGLSPT